jgi:hypothetical protein
MYKKRIERLRAIYLLLVFLLFIVVVIVVVFGNVNKEQQKRIT